MRSHLHAHRRRLLFLALLALLTALAPVARAGPRLEAVDTRSGERAVLADSDGDGCPEQVIRTGADGQVRQQATVPAAGAGGAAASAQVTTRDPRTGETLAVADTDGDGKADSFTRWDAEGQELEQGRLPSGAAAASFNPATGETLVVWDENGDGRPDRLLRTGLDGAETAAAALAPVHARATATDAATGVTTLAEDTDGDGRLDRITRRDRSGQMLFQGTLQPGAGRYATDPDPATGESRAAEDADGDGKPERLVRVDRAGKVLESTPLQMASARAEATAGDNVHAVEDTNQDGKFDLYTRVTVTGEFLASYPLAAVGGRLEGADSASGERGVAEDTDGDGKPDRFARRDGAGAEVERLTLTVQGARAVAINVRTGALTVVADDDRDGRFEKLWQYDGAGKVTAEAPLRPQVTAGAVTDPATGETTRLEDTGGDGRPDLVIRRDRDGRIVDEQSLRGTGQGVASTDPETGETTLIWDADGDGRLDRVAVHGRDGRLVSEQPLRPRGDWARVTDRTTGDTITLEDGDFDGVPGRLIQRDRDGRLVGVRPTAAQHRWNQIVAAILDLPPIWPPPDLTGRWPPLGTAEDSAGAGEYVTTADLTGLLFGEREQPGFFDIFSEIERGSHPVVVTPTARELIRVTGELFGRPPTPPPARPPRWTTARSEGRNPVTGETVVAEDTDGDGSLDRLTRRDAQGNLLEERDLRRQRVTVRGPGGQSRVAEDSDGDGRLDQVRRVDANGNTTSAARLRRGGERLSVTDPATGHTTVGEDSDGDGRLDRFTRTDRSGNEVGTRRLQPGLDGAVVTDPASGDTTYLEDRDGDGRLDRITRYDGRGQIRSTWDREPAAPAGATAATGTVPAPSGGRPDCGSPALDAAVARLKQYGIVRGDATGNVRPGDPITRAEFAKILVAAAGKEAQAAARTGPAPFPDLAGHWSAGYVAEARAAGWISGYPDGTFAPQRNVTFAEAVTLLVRFTGHAAAAGRKPGAWPENFIALAADDLAMVDESIDIRTLQGLPAIRSAVFVLADAAFGRVPMGAERRTVYQQFHGAP